jgi:uncharacterized membrane protein
MKNGLGLKKETSAALATLFGPTIVVPILFVLIEKDDYVRFWAMQSVVTSATLFVAFWAIGAFIFILGPVVAFVNSLLMLLGFVMWLTYVYKSWQGERWMAPFVGKIAENLLNKTK